MRMATRKYKSINVLRNLMRSDIVSVFVQLATCIASSLAVERLLPLGWRDEQLSLRNLSDIRVIAFSNLFVNVHGKTRYQNDYLELVARGDLSV